MGKRDSSRTRVVPVFNRLMDVDPSGRQWLKPLLSLGSYSAEKLDFDPGHLMVPHAHFWGKSERRLDPPANLLAWLVCHASKPSSDSLWGESATRQKREKLVARDPDTIADAVRLLKTR